MSAFLGVVVLAFPTHHASTPCSIAANSRAIGGEIGEAKATAGAPVGDHPPWSGSERAERSGGRHKRSAEVWGDRLGVPFATDWPLSVSGVDVWALRVSPLEGEVEDACGIWTRGRLAQVIL